MTFNCSRCGETKPLERKPKRGIVCKDCFAKAARERYASSYKYREAAKRRAAKWTKENHEFLKGYLREHRKKFEARYREKTAHQVKVRKAANNAIRDGRIVREPCVICKNPKSEAHHDDYARPLDVTFYCMRHHKAWHKIFKAENSQNLEGE